MEESKKEAGEMSPVQSVIGIVAILAMSWWVWSSHIQGFEIAQTEKFSPVAYKVVSVEDNSYLGCSRQSVYVTLEQESDVQRTLDFIRDEYLSSVGDVTVFAYRQSETDLVGQVPYTLGKSELSNCE